jgi:hypothetical protein
MKVGLLNDCGSSAFVSLVPDPDLYGSGFGVLGEDITELSLGFSS